MCKILLEENGIQLIETEENEQQFYDVVIDDGLGMVTVNCLNAGAAQTLVNLLTDRTIYSLNEKFNLLKG